MNPGCPQSCVPELFLSPYSTSGANPVPNHEKRFLHHARSGWDAITDDLCDVCSSMSLAMPSLRSAPATSALPMLVCTAAQQMFWIIGQYGYAAVMQHQGHQFQHQDENMTSHVEAEDILLC